MKDDVRDLEIATHAVLTVLHGLAALFHWRRRSYLHAAAHLCGVLADGYALRRHLTAPKPGTVIPDLGRLRRAGL